MNLCWLKQHHQVISHRKEQDSRQLVYDQPSHIPNAQIHKDIHCLELWLNCSQSDSWQITANLVSVKENQWRTLEGRGGAMSPLLLVRAKIFRLKIIAINNTFYWNSNFASQYLTKCPPLNKIVRSHMNNENKTFKRFVILLCYFWTGMQYHLLILLQHLISVPSF